MPTETQKEWTIMVYMAGDNNLSEDMITQLKGLKTNFGDTGFNLLALYDGSFPGAPTTIYDFSSNFDAASVNEEYPLSKFSLNDGSTVLGEKVSESFSIDKYVGAVLKQKKYKAKHYALILSGHGDGVLGNTSLRDDNPAIVINIKQLRKILEKSQASLGKEKNGKAKKFNLLGFDGCLMNMFEVGYELKDVAKVMVASEGNIPSTGWIYDRVLQPLIKAKGKMSEKDLGVSIVDEYVKYNKDYEIAGRSIDAGAVDLEEIEPIAKYFDKLAKVAIGILDFEKDKFDSNPPRDFCRQQFIDLLITSHYRSQTYMHSQSVDIIDFIENSFELFFKKCYALMNIFQPNTGGTLRSALANYLDINVIEELESDFNNSFQKALSKFCLSSGSAGAEYQFSRGIAIFFPWTKMAFDLLYPSYKKLQFNKDHKSWIKFIEKYVEVTLRRADERKMLFEFLDFPLAEVTARFLTAAVREHDNKEHDNKEHDNKEHDNKEHDNKGLGAFYRYFSQIRNYPNEFNTDKT